MYLGFTKMSFFFL